MLPSRGISPPPPPPPSLPPPPASMSLSASAPQLPTSMEIDSSSQSAEVATEQASPRRQSSSPDEFCENDVDIFMLSNRSRSLILDYLIRSCHKRSATAFAAALGKEPNASGLPSEIDEATLDKLDRRAVIASMMRQGKILNAVEAANDFLRVHLQSMKGHGTAVADLAPGLYFDLMRQHFIELVREGSADDALQFAQNVLAPLAKGSEANMNALQDVTVLLAYVEPTICPAGSLMDLQHREYLAEELNSQLYAACTNDSTMVCASDKLNSPDAKGRRLQAGSGLENSLRQLYVCGELSSPPLKLGDIFK